MGSAAKRGEDLTDLFVTASRVLMGIAVRSIDSAQVPVTVAQHRVLVVLAAQGPMAVGEIAALARINQSNASRLCDRLQKLGLVQRQRDAQDGRAVRVSLTEAGKQVLDTVTDARRREVGEILARLTADDARAAVSALVAFNEAAGEPEDRSWNLANA